MNNPQPNNPQPNNPQPNNPQPNNPLHGVTLAAILEHLVEDYGWEELGARIDIRCFTHDPSIKSSLKFLRKTEWARAKVERLYLRSVCYSKPKVVPSDEIDDPDGDNLSNGKASAGKAGPTDWDR
jgi:uncharacterized protein (DUF2132 family)